MFVTKKRFDQMMKSGDDLLAQRAAQALRDSETIGRLQRTSEDMLARNLELQAKVNEQEGEIAALRPDAEKYRERCRRDREHAENARVRKRAARQEAA